MLPDGQGIDLLRELRNKKNMTPVIILTAKADLIDKVLGLETGANDYLTKPFEPRELLARIHVQERLNQKGGTAVPEKKVFELNEIVMDLVKREVTFKGTLVELTKMEFDLLHLLLEYPNRAFGREELLNKVWGYENYPTTRTVDTHVLQLRQKFYDDLIETVRGVGYRLRKIEK
jgi:DNA-binding response OmpR family regulator